MATPVCVIDALYDHTARLRARDDLHALDVAASATTQNAFETTRERLLAISDRGLDALDQHGRLIITPDEYEADRLRLRSMLKS